MRSWLLEIGRDWPFYGFIAVYVAIIAVVTAAVGRPDHFLPFLYMSGWLRYLFAFSIGGLSLLALRGLFTPQPLRYALALFTPARIAGAALFAALGVFNGAFTSMKTTLPRIVPFAHDRLLANIDAAIHGGDPWRYLTFLDPVTPVLEQAYTLSWLFMVLLFTFAACVITALKPIRSQYLWTFLICWVVLGNLLALLGMSAGPLFFEQVVGDARFVPLTHHLAASTMQLGGIDVPGLLWRSYVEDRPALGSGISAFPSMHLSMATLFALLAFRLDRRFGFVMLAYLAFILMCSVHLGWHYAIDGYFSIAATILVWQVVGRCLAVSRPLQERAASSDVVSFPPLHGEGGSRSETGGVVLKP